MESLLDILSNMCVLKQYGKNSLRGLCPFHAEKTPSFFVNTDRNLFKCFGCGKAGGLKELLFLTGRNRESQRIKDEENKSKNAEQLKIYLEAFTNSFKAQSYIKSRGMNTLQAMQFNLGYDAKRNSIVFPIYDHDMQILSFSFGFIEHHEPKYIHSGNFAKSLHFFAYYNQMSASNDIWIVEGFFDALTMYVNKYNTLAVMGSYVSLDQADKIKQLFDGKNIILMLDGDWAGFCGFISSFHRLKNIKCNVLLFNWKQSSDPDELLKQNTNINLKEHVVDIEQFILSALERFDIQEVINVINKSDLSVAILKYICISLFEKNICLHLNALKIFEDENKATVNKINEILDRDISLSFCFRKYTYLLLDKTLHEKVHLTIDDGKSYQNAFITHEVETIIKKLQMLHLKYELYNLRRRMEILSFLEQHEQCSNILTQYMQLKKNLIRNKV